MKLEMEQLRLRLIETQMALLRYQHREVTDAIECIQKQSQHNQKNTDTQISSEPVCLNYLKDQ